jgi:hypothetical protein
VVRLGDEPLEHYGEVEIMAGEECIKKIWEVDTLLCPSCDVDMEIIIF